MRQVMRRAPEEELDEATASTTTDHDQIGVLLVGELHERQAGEPSSTTPWKGTPAFANCAHQSPLIVSCRRSRSASVTSGSGTGIGAHPNPLAA